MRHGIFRLLSLSLALYCVPAGADSFERQPLSRPTAERITVPPDRIGDEEVATERRPLISLLDEVKGEYLLTWIGHQGERKEIRYYEPDRIRVIVQALVSAGTTAKYRYEYVVRNEQASGKDVYGVIVQTFAERPKFLAPDDKRYIGEMTRAAPEFSKGSWYRIPLESGELRPGTTTRIVIESDSAPGLVHVRAHGGPLVMKGVGEEPPEVLMESLPRYEAWPVGLTIGPVDSIEDPDYPFRASRASEMIEVIVEAGWVGGAAGAAYLQMLESGAYRELLATVAEDIERGSVAPEVARAIGRAVGEKDQ